MVVGFRTGAAGCGRCPGAAVKTQSPDTRQPFLTAGEKVHFGIVDFKLSASHGCVVSTTVNVLDALVADQLRTDLPELAAGDTVRVAARVVEGGKERLQDFEGTVIARKGRGINETFTVRRISYGEGVERVFPLHSPRVDKVEVERKGSVRRAKLTYLRRRLGKGATLVREKEGKGAAGTPAEEKQ